LSKTSELLMNEKFRRRKTVLSRQMIIDITVLDTIAQIWDIAFLKEFIKDYTEYLTSIKGQGRKDIVDIAKYSLDKQKEMQKSMIDAFGRR